MALHEWLWIQGPDYYCDVIFKPMPGWDKCINVFGDYAEK